MVNPIYTDSGIPPDSVHAGTALAGRKVLLTCFNRRLGDWLTSECRTFGPGPITSGHLHRILREDLLASQFALEFDIKEPNYGRSFFAAAALAQTDLGRSYDAVIVDEAQDFDPLSLAEVLKVWRTASGCRLLLFADFSRQPSMTPASEAWTN